MKTNLAELEQRGYITSKARYIGENLVSILLQASGGTHPTCAWLYQQENGAWSHTFNKAIAVDGVGGAEIPIFCLADEKLFKPKESDVVNFLRAFQFTQPEIDAVIRANL